ncbi:MAG: hypothetical protein DYG98_19160 [Haliscomenobacteraceae bacterium CHB4]|nr:hypothetical protein [Saprospiraceae bacterium]MCE7925179.1 hypothetical protein [Haliscomenobacteraceae bacterium CHB4]
MQQTNENKPSAGSSKTAGFSASFKGEENTNSFSIQIPQISLPKGGGAIKGIDEKFQVNAANGTASLSLPLPFLQGRNGFMPAIGLGYNSGGGNGLFELGGDFGILGSYLIDNQ